MDILLSSLVDVIRLVFNIYIFIVIARALVSWVNPDPYNPIVRFLYQTTEPVLGWIRRVIPVQFGGIDFSPIVLLLALSLLQNLLLRMLARLAFGL